MALSLDWKCSLTNAILTVVAYLLLLKLFSGAGRPLHESAHWYESLEVLLLVASVVAFNVNSMLLSSCSNKSA